MKKTIIHTLGPKNTNCEKAANLWREKQDLDSDIVLFESLEKGLDELMKVKENRECYLLSCIVYPDLHSLVFNNLQKTILYDSFIMNTYNMVFAKRRDAKELKTYVSHPAPISLLTNNGVEQSQIELALSNSHAAKQCAEGDYDACITTITSAEENKLEIMEDFGEVPMGFAVHKRVS